MPRFCCPCLTLPCPSLPCTDLPCLTLPCLALRYPDFALPNFLPSTGLSYASPPLLALHCLAPHGPTLPCLTFRCPDPLRLTRPSFSCPAPSCLALAGAKISKTTCLDIRRCPKQISWVEVNPDFALKKKTSSTFMLSAYTLSLTSFVN